MSPSAKRSAKQAATGFRVRRAYDPPEPADGVRVLVDRLWPRGLSKDAAAVDEWPKELTPTSELRSWFHAHEDQYEEFERRYVSELEGPQAAEAVRHLRELARDRRVTLLTSIRDPDHSHARVLRSFLET